MNTWDLPDEQSKICEAIDNAVADSALEGFTIDPLKVARWKGYAADGMAWETISKIMAVDKTKVIAIAPKPEYRDSPGMKHMGNGYFISGDDPTDPPVK
jgi:hypothetical protein